MVVAVYQYKSKSRRPQTDVKNAGCETSQKAFYVEENIFNMFVRHSGCTLVKNEGCVSKMFDYSKRS